MPPLSDERARDYPTGSASSSLPVAHRLLFQRAFATKRRVQNEAPRGRLIAIGNFDGVHLGHQALLADAAADARARDLETVLFTFDPHPAAVIGRTAPALLTPLARKIELATRAEPALQIFVQRFDADFAAQSPRDFAAHVLVQKLSAKLVLVGNNFRFGKGRAGNFDTLTALGEQLGFETRSHPLVGDAAGTFSSTRAREAIATGNLEEASYILGRPHALSGLVIQGDKRGRTIGFPTANLDAVREALPPFGVYAVAVDRLQQGPNATGPLVASSLAAGVANIGVRPTVKQGAPPSIEVHLFEVDADLYGAHLRVHLLHRLRGEQRFSGLEALKTQIVNDAAAARQIAATLHTPSPGDPFW